MTSWEAGLITNRLLKLNSALELLLSSHKSIKNYTSEDGSLYEPFYHYSRGIAFRYAGGIDRKNLPSQTTRKIFRLAMTRLKCHWYHWFFGTIMHEHDIICSIDLNQTCIIVTLMSAQSYYLNNIHPRWRRWSPQFSRWSEAPWTAFL